MKALCLVLVLGTVVGCESRTSQEALKQSETHFATVVNEQFRALNDRKHTAYVEGAALLFGDRAGHTLAQCYSDGYDSIQNDDHSFATEPKLGPKYVARCDSIRKALDAHYAKADREHQKEMGQ